MRGAAWAREGAPAAPPLGELVAGMFAFYAREHNLATQVRRTPRRD